MSSFRNAFGIDEPCMGSVWDEASGDVARLVGLRTSLVTDYYWVLGFTPYASWSWFSCSMILVAKRLRRRRKLGNMDAWSLCKSSYPSEKHLNRKAF
jgi:hypothetical protein